MKHIFVHPASIFILLLSFNVFGEVGVHSQEIVIGTSIDLTAAIKDIGQGFVDGSNLVIEDINKSGGIHGRKINWIIKDDSYKPEKALENVKSLIETNKVFFLYGNSGTALLKASMPFIEKNEIPLLFPATGSPFVRTPLRKGVFTLRADYQFEADFIVKFLTRKGIKTWGIIAQDDAFGTASAQGLAKALAGVDRKIQANGIYRRLTNDYSTAIEEMNKAKPEVVYVQATPEAAIGITRALRKGSYRPILVFSSVIGSLVLSDELGKDADNIYVTDALPILTPDTYPVVRDYLRLTKAKKQKVHAFGLEGFLAAKITVEALQKAGKDLTRSKLIQSLESIQNFDLGGIKVSFSASEHQGMQTTYLYHFKNGTPELQP